jgi:hypothetical protein
MAMGLFFWEKAAQDRRAKIESIRYFFIKFGLENMI